MPHCTLQYKDASNFFTSTKHAALICNVTIVCTLGCLPVELEAELGWKQQHGCCLHTETGEDATIVQDQRKRSLTAVGIVSFREPYAWRGNAVNTAQSAGIASLSGCMQHAAMQNDCHLSAAPAAATANCSHIQQLPCTALACRNEQCCSYSAALGLSAAAAACRGCLGRKLPAHSCSAAVAKRSLTAASLCVTNLQCCLSSWHGEKWWL